jgi:hypothetical protein
MFDSSITPKCAYNQFYKSHHVIDRNHVTVMRSSRLRVGGLVLLPHFIRHFFPELHHRYVM